MLAQPVSVPKVALLHSWGLEGLGEPHPVLGSHGLHVPSGRTAEFTRQCLELLARVGLSTEQALTSGFRDTLRTLARPSRELYCWSAYADPHRDGALLVAERDGEAVAAFVHGDTVSLRSVDPRRLVEEFVALLPPAPAASVRSLSVPRSEFESTEAVDEDDGFRITGRRDVKELRDHLKAPREGVHQLYGAVTVNGARRRSDPLSLIDVAGLGRMLVFRDAEDFIQRRPGSVEALTEALAVALRGRRSA
ncbi:ESX secretion-associated protein EspG [Saccharomonospora glauca]|jgi:hypothetical protein|uniref:EspG family n=1 Tax=Saccharomonospora glauca K62 TaxID=928724 RepID=I1D754_9PSEU|nr:ESX secretion-associated protein EspG [Saccharomonospora glauca]EIF00779.1 hypothetical protein SacglDRAFT_03936 [Saccharomonospora glauca K62]